MSAGNSDSVLFPDFTTFGTFSLLVTLFVCQGLLVTASKSADGSYDYNTTTVVLLCECFKLLLSMFLFLRNNHWSIKTWLVEFVKGSRVLVLYLIPAFLYCLYNNLAFTNLRHFDPTSYFLLLNFRTVTTGILFSILFPERALTRRQWLALMILTAGCVVKQVRLDAVSGIKIHMDINLAFMLLQIFCSCFAGVYNEYLLKDTGKDVNIWIQNAYMYADSIFMNIGFMALQGTLMTAFTSASLSSVFLRPGVLAIAVNNSLAGVTTSVFLKTFNSILKTFAGAVELLLTAVASWILFGIEINGSMLLSISLVSVAMYLYSTQPVANKTQSKSATLLPVHKASADSV